MSDIKDIEQKLIDVISEEFEKDISLINTDEMGKVIDMLKDVADARYHCSVSNAMKDESNKYYTTSPLFDDDLKHTAPYYLYAKGDLTPEEYRRIEEITNGRMYYTETGAGGNVMPVGDERYGTSWEVRKRYFETSDGNKMQTLEEYTKALTDDVMDMVKTMTENEKQMLRTKMQMLSQKI